MVESPFWFLILYIYCIGEGREEATLEKFIFESVIYYTFRYVKLYMSVPA